MPLDTLTTPETPGAPGSYTFADTLDADYTTTAGTTSGANKTLQVRLYWPTFSDPEIPRMLVVMVAGSSWILSEIGQFATEAQYIAEMGCVVAVVETRDRPDDPLSTGDEASNNVLRRAMRAAVFDLDLAIEYIFENYLEYEDGGDRIFTLDPTLTVLAGQSQGSVTACQYSIEYPNRPIAGIIAMAAAYGGDGLTVNSETATAIMRQQLKHVERRHRVSTCAFLGGADTTIGTTYIEAFREWLPNVGGSIVHYDADGGHVGYDAFDTTALTGASTVEEAVNNFLISRFNSALPTAVQRRTPRTYNRSWPKLQSRFW